MTTVSNIAIGAHLAGNAAANAEGMASRIMDSDFAKSSANLAKFTVLNQSTMAMVAQANRIHESILIVLES